MADHIWTVGFLSALTNSAQTVKATQGGIGGYYIYNPDSAAAYVQFFDESGTITIGTTTPKMSIGVPAGAAAHIEFAHDIPFLNSIKVAATTTATGLTAPGTSLVANIFYK